MVIESSKKTEFIKKNFPHNCEFGNTVQLERHVINFVY